MAGVNVRTMPDMEVENYDDADGWQLYDAQPGILAISRGDEEIATYNAMGWVSVWHDDEEDDDE